MRARAIFFSDAPHYRRAGDYRVFLAIILGALSRVRIIIASLHLIPSHYCHILRDLCGDVDAARYILTRQC